MATTAMLAPRAHSDSAIDRDVRREPGGGLDRYRTWVTDHRVSAALLAAVVATHMATVIGYWMPGIGLPFFFNDPATTEIYTPNLSPDLQFLSGGVFHYL